MIQHCRGSVRSTLCDSKVAAAAAAAVLVVVDLSASFLAAVAVALLHFERLSSAATVAGWVDFGSLQCLLPCRKPLLAADLGSEPVVH